MKRGRLKDAAEHAMTEAGMCSALNVNAGRDVMAHGAQAIISYSESEVRLRLCDMILCVKGCNLTMKSYFGGSVRVSGVITELCFEH